MKKWYVSVTILMVLVVALMGCFKKDPKYVLGFGDSGAGGLIFALDAYKELLPFLLNVESKYEVEFAFHHIGDTKNAPYGQKTPEELVPLTKGFVRYLVEEAHSNIAVIACNTASTVVDNKVEEAFKQEWPNTPVMPIIEKSAMTVYKKAVIMTDKKGNKDIYIGILGTPATIASGKYQEALDRIHSENYAKDGVRMHTFFYGPSTWVPDIEHGATKEKSENDVKLGVASLLKERGAENISVVGLFCTHFPFFKNEIRANLEAKGIQNVQLISQGQIFAGKIQKIIQDDIASGKIKLRKKPLDIKKIQHPQVYSDITGTNLEDIKNVVQKIAPDMLPKITFRQVEFKK